MQLKCFPRFRRFFFVFFLFLLKNRSIVLSFIYWQRLTRMINFDFIAWNSLLLTWFIFGFINYFLLLLLFFRLWLWLRFRLKRGLTFLLVLLNNRSLFFLFRIIIKLNSRVTSRSRFIHVTCYELATQPVKEIINIKKLNLLSRSLSFENLFFNLFMLNCLS